MKVRAIVVAGILTMIGVPAAVAHEVRPAYLELHEIDADTYDVFWKVPANGEYRLRLDVQMPEQAERTGDLAASFQGGAYLERWRVHCAGGLVGQTIHIGGLAATRIDVLARIERLNGATQTVRVLPDRPFFAIEAEPSRLDVLWTYLVLGVEHILLGFDHLLFVLALVLIVDDRRKLIGTVTAFTVAHSITLAIATLGHVRVPSGPVEACIALSIAFVAAEIVHARHGRASMTARFPWLVAFAFGLLHGLGFAGALAEVGLPHGAIPVALLMFNVGVEVGQLMFIAVALGTLAALRRLPVPQRDWGWRVAPYAIGSVAMFWVIQRTAAWW
jgi:hydrogenase/urease accessory protein HupE